MPSQEDIEAQQELLVTYRRNLANYLRQQARIGIDHVPPSILNGIQDARDNIARIKRVLHNWGVEIENHPDDGSPIDFVAAPQAHPNRRTTEQQSPPRPRVQGWLFIRALITGLIVLSSLLVAYYVVNSQTAPIEITAYCAVFNQSPIHIKANQPTILYWKWRANTEGYRQDYIDAVSFSLQIDGQPVDTSSAVQTLSQESGAFVVTWRLSPRTFSVGTYQVTQTATLSRQITDGYDSNNDGVLDTFGPGVISNPPCEINAI